MASKNIGIVTWLKQWFYDKLDIDKLIVDEEEYSSSSTTTLTKILNPNYKLDNSLNWIFSCDIKITGNVSSRLELSPLGLDRGHHISIGVNTAGTSSLWWTPSSDSGETGETITTLTKNTYYHLDFVKQDNSISIYLDNVVLKTLTFDWFKKYDFLVKLTTWGTANNGIAVKNIYINHKNVQVSPNEVGEYIVGTQTSATNKWTGKSNKLTKLQNGTVIYYKLPFASTNADVTLNLTLADGSTTGEKNVWFWNGSRVRNQYGIYSVVGLVYNGSEWWVINPSNNNNNDYLRVATRIVNGESSQIPANRIICGCQDSNNVGKYYILKSGVVLDTQYPILYNTGAMNSDSYTDNTYVSHTGVSLRNNVSNATVTTQKQVYIEGTKYFNGKFTVSSNVFKSEDNLVTGNYYIYIGVSYSTYQIRFNSLHQQVYRMTKEGLIAVTNPTFTVIPNGTSEEHNNLNNYTIAGFYGQPANANTSYIDNLPNNTKLAFTLLVEQFDGYCKQTLTFINLSDPQTFIRIENWNNNSWGNWKEIAWTTDAMTPQSHNHYASDIILESGAPFLNDNNDYIYFLGDKLEYSVNEDVIRYNNSELVNADDLNSKANVSHGHGKLSSGGVINYDTSTVGKVVVTDTSGNLRTISKLPQGSMDTSNFYLGTPQVVESQALSNIGTVSGAYQHDINYEIDIKIGELEALSGSSNFELKHSQVFKGCTIKWYSDGLYVYCVVNGSFTGLTANGYTNIGTMTDTDYAPPFAIVNVLTGATTLSTITITDTGVLGVHNKTSGTSLSANTTLMYPLKSRMP